MLTDKFNPNTQMFEITQTDVKAEISLLINHILDLCEANEKQNIYMFYTLRVAKHLSQHRNKFTGSLATAAYTKTNTNFFTHGIPDEFSSALYAAEHIGYMTKNAKLVQSARKLYKVFSLKEPSSEECAKYSDDLHTELQLAQRS